MKTKHFLIIGTLGAALAGSIFAGCKKDTTPTTTTTTSSPSDYTAAQDDANASFTVQDTKNIADGAAKGQATDRTMGGYPMLVPHSDTTIGTVTDSVLDVYFGPTDILCADGRLRRGHVLVWYLPHGYFTQGNTIGMGFQNYFVNDIGITGSRNLTNTGVDSAGLHTWAFTANLTLTYPNSGGTATWTSTRTNTLTKVAGTFYYSITGTASGVSRKGINYSITITSPIYVTALPYLLGGCRYFEAGNVTVTIPTYSIDLAFGTAIGTCSDAATATINGKTYNFLQQ